MFDALKDASIKLSDVLVPSEDKEEILKQSSIGSYWDKFGDISGKFIVFHILRHRDITVIQKGIEDGPSHLFRAYQAIREDEPSLPSLPQEFYLESST